MKSQRGSAVVNALIFIAALAILGLSLSHLATSRLAASRQRGERLQAQAAAESGLEEALYHLQQDPTWYADGSDSRPLLVRELPDWRYEVRVIPNRDGISYAVTSEGKVGTTGQMVTRTFVTTSPTRYALYAMEKLTVHTSGSISGMVYAGKEFSGALPDGTWLDTYPAAMHRAELPKLEDFLARRPDRILEGYLRDYRIENRFLYKAGTLTLDQGVMNNVSWIADGTITVQGKTIATAREGLPLLFANGDMLINLAPGSQLTGMIVCRGTLTITGSGDISGCIIARNIDCGGTVNLAVQSEKATLPGFTPLWWTM
jgi:hypothetical protein